LKNKRVTGKKAKTTEPRKPNAEKPQRAKIKGVWTKLESQKRKVQVVERGDAVRLVSL